MAEQIGFEFNADAAETAGDQPKAYPLEIAFRLLGMMAGEALYYIEQIVEKAGEADVDEIKALARRAIAHLTDEPTRSFVNASAVRPRAIQISKDCDYG